MIDSDKTCDGTGMLDLSGLDFTKAGALEELLLLVQGPSCPKKLDLSTAKFSREAFPEFLSSLQGNTCVIDLNLSTNHLCGDYISNDGSISSFLKTNKTLQKLNLTGHSLTHEVILDLTEGLKQNSTMLELVLHNCSLTEESAALVMQSATSVRALDLGSNKNITPEFLNTTVAKALNENKNLQSLVLNHSAAMFAVASAEELNPFFRALETSTTLTSLSLRSCRLTEAVGEALLRTLTINESLTFLDLEFSGFGLRDRGNEILIGFLPQFKTLQQLKFLVRYEAKMLARLLEAIQKCPSLRVFRPMLAPDCKDQQDVVQAVLECNLRLAEVKSMLHPGAYVPASLLPSAVSHLNQSNAGSAATFQALKHWIFECL